MVRKARTTIIVSAVVAGVTCGSTLHAARDASPETRANRDRKSQRALGDCATLTVRITPLVRLTRGDTYGTVIVPRHADNRLLRVILESEDYYSRSDIPLDGEYAALSYPVSWRDLPAGSYSATVQVYGPNGMRTSTSIGSIHTLQMDR
jgi:hypothetical protein